MNSFKYVRLIVEPETRQLQCRGLQVRSRMPPVYMVWLGGRVLLVQMYLSLECFGVDVDGGVTMAMMSGVLPELMHLNLCMRTQRMIPYHS